MNRWHTYCAYGLRLDSVLPLPELKSVDKDHVQARGAADIVIRVAPIEGLPRAVHSGSQYLHPTAHGVYLRWPGIATVAVRNGSEIVIDPAPGIAADVLRTFILSVPLAIALHLRGCLVLHASAVNIRGEAVAFVGHKEAGKSSMTAALHERGHDLVADDIVVIERTPEGPVVAPGVSQIKLWPDTIRSLGGTAEALPRLLPWSEKRLCSIATGFAPAPVRLHSLCLLSQGPDLGLEPLPQREAVVELLPHWYGARFGRTLLDQLGMDTHFSHCTHLADQVRVYRLSRPRSLARLPDVVDLVEARFGSLSPRDDTVDLRQSSRG